MEYLGSFSGLGSLNCQDFTTGQYSSDACTRAFVPTKEKLYTLYECAHQAAQIELTGITDSLIAMCRVGIDNIQKL